MGTQVISIFGNAVANASLWFDKVFEACEGKTIYIASISIIFVMRYLLKPILGGGSSDKAKEKKGDEK